MTRHPPRARWPATAVLVALAVGCAPGLGSTSEGRPRPEGATRWHVDLAGESLEATPAVGADGSVYMLVEGRLHSYTRDGAPRWSTAVSAGDGDVASLSPDGRIVYAPGTTGVVAVSADTGEVLWRRSGLGDGGFSTVAAVSSDGARVYLGEAASDRFHALNATDGSVAWTYQGPSAGSDTAGYLGGAVLDDGGDLYVTSQRGWVISLSDQGDRPRENWRFDLGAEARQPAALSVGGDVVQTSNTGVVHRIDRSSGSEVTSGQWPALGGVGEVFASPAFSPDGSTLYVNAEDARIYAVDFVSGSVKWSYRFEGWGSDPLVRDDGVLVVMAQIDGAGRVVALDDHGDEATLRWQSEPIVSTLELNETNVNIAPDGTIYVHSGDQPPSRLFAIEGNGSGLSAASPWPRYMGGAKGNGNR